MNNIKKNNKKYFPLRCGSQCMKFILGIISKGGVKPNIIPDETELEYYIRAPIKKELDVLTEKVINCFHSAAKATGCTVRTSQIRFFNLMITTTVKCCYYFKSFLLIG